MALGYVHLGLGGDFHGPKVAHDFFFFFPHDFLIKGFEGFCAALWRVFQVVLVVKSSLANARDIRDTTLIPGSGRSPRGGHDNPLQ